MRSEHDGRRINTIPLYGYMLALYPLFYNKLYHISLNIPALIKKENEKAVK